jgi:branched-chain amino acid transport system ATP-binding protein
MSGPAIIETDRVSAGYHQMAVVHDLSLRVEPGEVVALLGANGAGKTTTLLTLAGELKPLRGKVAWKGSTRFTPLFRRSREGMRFITEERSVFMSMTVTENLQLGGVAASDCYGLFPELEPLAKRKAGLLSGGEQQMLTLARALAGDAQLLLADELSLGLAPLVSQRLLRAVRAAASERGMGVVLVEQQVRQALTVADRVYVLQRGRVMLEGTSEEMRGQIGKVEASYLSGMPDEDGAAVRAGANGSLRNGSVDRGARR